MKNTSPRKKDFYRPAFCEPSFYVEHLKQFEIIEQFIKDFDLKTQLTIWIITCSCLRKPDRWFSGLEEIPNKTGSAVENTSPTLPLLFELFQKMQLPWPQKISRQISLFDFCKTVRINPLPRAALNALFYFYTGDYPLKVLPYEPAPEELLKLQIAGFRVITFNSNYQQWPFLKYGERDPLSFWIHDLIHAEHFFSDPIHRQAQIGFYYFIQEIIQNKILDDLRLNTQFNDAFHYLISDMNSHAIHLLKTLKAMIDIYEPAPKGLLWRQILSTELISERQDIMSSLAKVNEISFDNHDAIRLTNYLNLDLYHLTLS